VADNFGDSINVVIYFKRDDFNFDIVNFPHLSYRHLFLVKKKKNYQKQVPVILAAIFLPHPFM
jgi:hypothetical protein